MWKRYAKALALSSGGSLLALGLFLLFLKFYFRSYAEKPQTLAQAMVEIPRGTPLKGVSLLLHQQKIIDNPSIFYWYMRLGRSDGNKIQAGFYQFDGVMTMKAIADSLRTGRDRAYKIVFKEGETLNDLVASLEKNGLVSEAQFIEAMRASEILALIPDPLVKERRFLKNDMGGIEGYLFPDSYFFTQKDGAEAIIKKMHQRLLDKLKGPVLERMKERGLSLHEVLTLAAIVEKETGALSERPVIASVYQNRLAQKMRLQADPTVIYGIKDYNGKIRKSDLLTFHPYNTYKIQGLPPGPIAAAGLESIRAVLWPSESKFIYFVSRNDGTHIFCENLNCHNQAVKKWQVDFWKPTAQKR